MLTLICSSSYNTTTVFAKTSWEDPRQGTLKENDKGRVKRNVYVEPSEERLKEAAKWNAEHADRPVTPPSKYQAGKRFKATNLQGYSTAVDASKSSLKRNLNFVGTLGGGSEAIAEESLVGAEMQSGAASKTESADERRNRMIAAAERRNDGGTGTSNNLGAKISKEKAEELALKRQRDTLLGKIRAYYAARGMSEPFGLAAAPLETLRAYLERAKTKAASVAPEAKGKAKERALRSRLLR